ncbi:MAG TPA: transposase [Burkholderiales bacterium]|nr:transposase [Burkholderiales bacterium]
MPRKPRLQAAGLPVHIIQRGNNRQACFFAEDDYRFFLDHLAKLSKRFRCSLHAYVLMTNHFHLLLTSDLDTGPSLLMKFLGQRYVQYVNRVYKRSGSLWEGRFRSSLVQTERYVLGCYRYIEMNPVRANMVKHPGEYPWSSYAVNAIGKKVEWLIPHGEYLALGDDESRRRNAYARLFATELDPGVLSDIRISTHGGYAVGDSRFREQIERSLQQRATPRSRGRPSRSIA